MPNYTLPKKKKSNQDANDAGRRLKKKRKHKGLPSGHRHLIAMRRKNNSQHQDNRDPYHGSKKRIPLICDAAITDEKVTIVPLSPEKELAQLENDPKLEQYLDRIDAGETLTQQEQYYLDKHLTRIDNLIKKLGYQYHDEICDEDDGKDIMKILKQ